MREDLLHFIWKFKKLPILNLSTSDKELVSIIDVGRHNHLAGPDFFNARVEIDGQLWAGNVEIHIKSSDWYAHKHEVDENYDNVILHVVWEDDAAVFRKNGSEIPTIELKNYIPAKVLSAYQNLFSKQQKSFINCEKDLTQIDAFTIHNWLERLYIERLESKSDLIFELLEASNNNWEHVLFTMLLKNFGLKINGDAFLSLGDNIDFSIIRKLQTQVNQMESVFFGMCHLLEDETTLDSYYLNLKKEFRYLCSKFDLNNIGVLKPQFFKLRPPNFPTIRLSQFANLYTAQQNLFDKINNANSLNELYLLFEVSASDYWITHFTFGKISKKSTKKLTKNFIELLIINTILPMKFCFAKHLGKDNNDQIINIVNEIHAEDNSVVSNFKTAGLDAKNAKDSQAVLQLYNQYCTKNRCLECAVGSTLLLRND